MIQVAAFDLRALLLRETIVSALVNAMASIGFFMLVFGWAPVRGYALAIDFLPQTFGITFLGGLVPSFLMLARIRRGVVPPAGAVPTRSEQIKRVFGYALVATPLLGGGAGMLMWVFGPAILPPQTALIVKALYGGLVGLVTTPPILWKAMGMSVWPAARPDRDRDLMA